MLILLCILCVVLYRRQRREGFFKKLKKGFKKHFTAPTASIFKSFKQAIGYKSPAQLAKEARDRAAKAACQQSEQAFIRHSGERATIQDNINNLTQISKDPNFKVYTYNYLNDELYRLKTALDTNTELNNELNSVLKATVGYQTNSHSLMDTLQKKHIQLTECNINKKMSNHDYHVLN